MNVQEALGNLDQVCADFRGTRTDHVTLQQSLKVVAETFTDSIGPKKEPEPDKESDGNK